MIIRELITKFGFDVDEEKIKSIDKFIDKSIGGLDGLAKKSTQVGKQLSTFVTLPILGIGAAAVKAASDSEETLSKFGTVFKDIDGQAERTAKDFAKNFGLSSTAARQFLGDTGDLLTGLGFTQESALDVSKQVNELAVDLASFTNFSGGAEGASQALTKALLGERESIKSLGIAIGEEDVKARVLKNTQDGLTFASERQAKAFATLQLAQEQSKNAIGDYARTNQGFANQLRLLRARVSDVAVSFGKILLPPALALVKVGTRLVEFFEGMSEGVKTTILIIAGLVAVIGPLLLLFGAVASAIVSITTAFGGLAVALGVTNAALLLLIAKFVLIGLAVAAAFAIVFLVIEDLIAFFRGGNSLTGVIVEEIGKAVDFIGEKFNELPGFVRGAIALATTPLRAFIASVRAIGGVLGALSGGDFGGALDAIKEGFSNTFDLGGAVTNNGLGGLLGFGPSAPAGGGTQQTNSVGDILVTVPEGTSPDDAVRIGREGVQEGLFDLFTETGRQVASPIAE